MGKRDANVDPNAADYVITAHATNPGLSRLRSPALDAAMHPDGTSRGAPILIENFIGDENNPEGATSIDAFQVASIERYVASQHDIRTAMERGVIDYMARNYPELKLKPGATFWKKVSVQSVYFPRKSVMTRERFEKMKAFAPKLNEAMFEKMVASGDRIETRSGFQVFVRGPWENEHEHFGRFRDGAFVGFAFQ